MSATEPGVPVSSTADAIRVEVVYAIPEHCWCLTLHLVPGSTVADAIARFQREGRCPLPIDLAPGAGIFGKSCDPQTRLRDGDRVEIYRPLLIDPKEERRARAKRSRS